MFLQGATPCLVPKEIQLAIAPYHAASEGREDAREVPGFLAIARLPGASILQRRVFSMLPDATTISHVRYHDEGLAHALCNRPTYRRHPDLVHQLQTVTIRRLRSIADNCSPRHRHLPQHLRSVLRVGRPSAET